MAQLRLLPGIWLGMGLGASLLLAAAPTPATPAIPAIPADSAPAAAAPLPLPLPTGLRWREAPQLKDLFRDAGVQGSFVLLAERGTLVGVRRDRALSRYSPASTFKIANTLIGLSVGAVASVDSVLPYRSDAPPFSPAWEKDMSLREAIVVSNVPIYQELARRIGLSRMRQALNKLGYGNQAVGRQVDSFWLRGPLAISAVEQVQFLDRLAHGSLPFPAEAQRAVREITVVERGPGWVLHAKTGWQNGPGAGVGWWVGWLERGARITPFALNLDIRRRADADLRQRLGRQALERLGLLPAGPGRPRS